MKNKLSLYIAILFLGIFSIHAQKKGGNKYEKIKTLKINFISDELNLSPEAAEKFWPIYNEYEETNRKLRSSSVKNIKEELYQQGGEIGALSDLQASEFSEKFLQIVDKYAENKRKTFDKLEAVLTPQQILQLHFAEIEFNYKVLRKLKDKHSGKK